jgi:hypothetical protein
VGRGLKSAFAVRVEGFGILDLGLGLQDEGFKGVSSSRSAFGR